MKYTHRHNNTLMNNLNKLNDALNSTFHDHQYISQTQKSMGTRREKGMLL